VPVKVFRELGAGRMGMFTVKTDAANTYCVHVTSVCMF
jgi:hypothetical protein